MTRKITTLFISLLIATAQVAFGQGSDKEKALGLVKEAIGLMDEGKVDESIGLLEQAQKLDPESLVPPYELAYAYYLKKDYQTASRFLEGLLKHKDVDANVYQLLGNAYDYLGNPDKAIATYEAGLNLFPKSGNLHLELGIMQLGKKEYDKALSYFEKGIDVAPTFPSNYYWAAKLFFSSSEEVWGMIYGEIFMNLERNSRRTAEISKLLFDTYRSEIKFTSDTSFSVSFSKNATINIGDLSDPGKIKLPYGMSVYEPTLMLSMLSAKSIDLATLNQIRSNFVGLYFSIGHDKNYPNLLFRFQKELQAAGHLEAYNYWILMKGDEEEFRKWREANMEKWNQFVSWFTDNKLKIDHGNKFHRSQY